MNDTDVSTTNEAYPDIDVSAALQAMPEPGKPGFSYAELQRLTWADNPPSWGVVERKIREHDRLRLAYGAGGRVAPTCIVCGSGDAPREPFCAHPKCRLLALAAGDKQARDCIARREEAEAKKERAVEHTAKQRAWHEKRKQEVRANPPSEEMAVLWGGTFKGVHHKGILTTDDPYEPPAESGTKKKQVSA